MGVRYNLAQMKPNWVTEGFEILVGNSMRLGPVFKQSDQNPSNDRLIIGASIV